MIHDELLNKIEAVDYWQEQFANKTFLKALLAVVELHKPDIKGGCSICSWMVNGFVLYSVCPTIKAIEEALQ